jgi:hypothetical protein
VGEILDSKIQSNAGVSHHVFADVQKLMVDDSDVDSEDEDRVSRKVIAVGILPYHEPPPPGEDV